MAPTSPEPSRSVTPPVPAGGSRVLFGSTRVNIPCPADRETLISGIAVLYDQLDVQAATLSDYASLEATCHDQRSQIDRLQAELRSYIEIAPRLAAYVQQRYTRLWNDHQDLFKRSSDYQEELGKRVSDAREVKTLKTSLLQANVALQREKDW